MPEKNVYQRLLEMRVEFHQRPVKKSGWNNFGKYSYYELSDIVPHALELAVRHGLIFIFTYDAEYARLQIMAVESPDDRMEITAPLGSADLKAAHEIQNIGAVLSYQRRYLYVAALDIIETEDIDRRPPKKQDSQPAKKPSSPPAKNQSKPDNPELDAASGEFKTALDDLRKREAAEVADAYRTEGKTLYHNGDIAGLKALAQKVRQHQPADFQDDIPDDIY